MNFHVTNDLQAEKKEDSFVDVDLSKLEAELRDYVVKQQVCSLRKSAKA